MKIDVIEDGSVTIMALTGRLDSTNAVTAEKEVSERVESGTQQLVFDFGQLEYISSAGLRVILKAAKQIRAAGGDMAIYGMHEKVREVFEMSGFLSILTVRDNRDAAVAAVAP
jgi:anti-anti-sigma factor